jgi:hypothetical protein
MSHWQDTMVDRARNGWRGLRDGLDDFRPSRNRRNPWLSGFLGFSRNDLRFGDLLIRANAYPLAQSLTGLSCRSTEAVFLGPSPKAKSSPTLERQ